MAPRPYWKGYLKLSLVSCPIALTPATSSSEKVSFRQVNKATGNRIRYKKVDSETDEEVETADIGKGYEVGKNEFLIMDDDELESIQLESTHTIDIDQFVPFTQIDKRYYDQPYYVGFNVGGYELGLDPDTASTRPGPGGSVAYWGVADIDAAVRHLQAVGATRAGTIGGVGEGIRVAVLDDPFGNAFGVIQNPHFKAD